MSDNTFDTLTTPPNAPSPFRSDSSRPMPSAVRPTPPHYPPPPYYQQPSARTFGCAQFFLFGLAALGVLGALGVGLLLVGALLLSVASNAFDEITTENQEKTVTEKYIGGNRDADNKIVIITIDGVITGGGDGFVAKQIRRVMSDTSVKAVVLRVDSPGGTMTGSDYYLYRLKNMKSERQIPVVVSMGSIAASGGYYVSMVGDEIYAEPSTITGSIGVIASLYDASELLQKIGVEANPITSGPHKTMGSFAKPMSEEERAIWQHLIDDNFERFKQVIREGREEFADNPEELDKLATGRIFTANEAVKNKLIDKIGFIDDAIHRAGDMAKLTERDCKVIQYKPKLSILEAFGLESRAPSKLLSGKTLTEVTTPKVYLLCPNVIPVDSGE